MTVKELVAAGFQNRLDRLIELNAPEIMIKKAQEFAESPPVKGLIEFADLEVQGHTWAKGRGGRSWCKIQTKNGELCFFPHAKWGAFIKRAGN